MRASRVTGPDAGVRLALEAVSVYDAPRAVSVYDAPRAVSCTYGPWLDAMMGW
jgi:hypothetical protein